MNVSGLEFRTPFVPTTEDLDFYINRGARAIRLPVKRARLMGSAQAIAQVRGLVAHGSSRGVLMIIDDHTYSDIGNPDVEAFWRKLGPLFKGQKLVAFDLQNEPSGDWETYGTKAKTLIHNLRAAGIDNRFLLEWRQASGAQRIRRALESFDRDPRPLDPLNRTWLSPHKYFDSDGSGRSTYCRKDLPPGGAFGIATVEARRRGLKLFLGEFGWGRAAGITAGCAALAPQMIAYLKANADVWVGGTVWGGGRFWSPKYTFRFERSKDREATWRSRNAQLVSELWQR